MAHKSSSAKADIGLFPDEFVKHLNMRYLGHAHKLPLQVDLGRMV